MIVNMWDNESGILETRNHNVSETGSVSVLSWGKTPTPLGPLERANLNHWTIRNVASFRVLYNTGQQTKSKKPSNTMMLQNWTSSD
jgi:hypothetical protein